MRWLKPFLSILLFTVSVLVVRSSSTNRVKNNDGWSKKNSKDIGEKRHNEANKRTPKVQALKSTNGFVFTANADRSELDKDKRRLYSSSVTVEPEEPKGTKNQIPEPSKINSSERQKRKTLHSNGRLHSDILNRQLSKDEVDIYEFLNQRKRVKEKIVSNRIARRNVYTRNATAPVCRGGKSCLGRCTGNITEWRSDETLSCYCDTACYEIFNDCCSDYTKYCGEQKPSNISIKKFKWTCEPLGHFRSRRHCKVGEGLWMVSRCADDWPYDRIRRECENPAKFLRKPLKFKRHIPVTSGNVTFRNYFCAECNHIAGKIEFFPVEIKTNVLPPENYNFKQKVEFLLSYGSEFPEDGPWTPKSSQKRRYCLKSIVDSCPDNATSESCTDGSVEPVSRIKSFKNHYCALCNDPNGYYSCFPPTLPSVCYSTPPQRFLLNLDYQWKCSVLSVLKTSCGSKGLIFDDKLQECVQDIPPPSGNEGKILVLAWFDSSKILQHTENDFKTVMKQHFGVERSQIYNVTVDTVSKKPWFQSSTMLFISSTFKLTPEQLFDVVFENDSKSSTLNLRSFIHFNEPLNVSLNNITFTVIKTTSRPLSCNARVKHYTRETFMTGAARTSMYEKMEYDQKVYENITMCKEDHSRHCKLDQIKLTKKDFVINANLSIYHQETGVLYELGQYDVTGDSILLCNLEHFNVSTFFNINSCKGRCSNQAELQTEVKMRCSCEPDCYKVFNNCCSDYTKYCGTQMPRKTFGKRYNYVCEEFAVYASKKGTASGKLWMVTQCRPDGTSRTKFDAPSRKLNMSFPDPSYIPGVGRDNTTFRSVYSAVCNDSYESEHRPLDTKGYYVIPPEYYNFTEKMRFLLSHAGNFSEHWQRLTFEGNQTKQYCLRKFIDSKIESWDNDNVAVMKVGQRYYKNTHCAECQSWPRQRFSSFSGEYLRLDLDKDFLEVSLLRQVGVKSLMISSVREVSFQNSPVVEGFMSLQNILDPVEKRPKLNFLSLEALDVPYSILLHSNIVYAWLKPLQNSQNTSFTPTEFQESLARYLNISKSQITETSTKTVWQPTTTSSFLYLVSSNIRLTSQQHSELARRSETTSTNPRLLNYIYYSEPFILEIKNLSYMVTKTISRPLACVENTTYTPEEYTLHKHGRVLIKNTNKTYGKFQYYKESVEKPDGKSGNITVCEKYVPTKCNWSTVLYTIDEYIMMVNLSIFVKKTSSLYHYGEYEILSNKSVTTCQYFKLHIITKTIRDNGILGYMTFVSFLLSILFLIFLLVTYLLFPQLQTLPGKNLMNFATSLILFQIGWLLLNINEIRSDEPACTAMAVIEHYFLIASFVSMSVIAFHTCKVFARRFLSHKMSQGHERKLFYKYLLLVWLFPGIFVSTCVVLDGQDVAGIGYGKIQFCWLTEGNSYIYFVIIPIAVLLLFNVVAFVTAAIYLRRHAQNNAAKQASGNRRSTFLIYVKLSTLMGFSWLFGMLAIVVKSTAVFWYLFVIFSSLQGVFIAVAFVLNTKTFGLYKQWYRSGSRVPKNNRQERSISTKV